MRLEFLDKIKSGDQHLEKNDRFSLYQSFGPSRLELPFYEAKKPFNSTEKDSFHLNQILGFTQADYVLGGLAILTAKHVSPIWDKAWLQLPPEFKNVATPNQILEIAQNILDRKIEINEKLFELCADFEIGLNIEEWVTYDVASTYSAAYYTLHLILFGGQNLKHTFSFDTEIASLCPDFASEALKGYSAIDKNPPGEGFAEEMVEFDPQRRLEFWEWWLTEAIPQAWNLAHKTNS